MRRTTQLETVFVIVPETSVSAYEAAITLACTTIGIFVVDEERKTWRVEGVKSVGEWDSELLQGLSLASSITGTTVTLHREATEAEGWLARNYNAFPQQEIGRHFAIRGTHHTASNHRSRHTLTVDAGLAFGSGEHGSTRGCLRALEHVAYRRPRRIVDIGCGSGILAMAAASLLHRPVLAIDNDPWSVRVTARNVRQNALHGLVRVRLGNGLQNTGATGYDLILANILARPLCQMAAPLAAHLAQNGTVILAGLLTTQIAMVLSAYRRQKLRLERTLSEGQWATLILRKP